MSERAKPQLWSDFDGTAVGLVPKTNWRNWSKYPLPAIEGYMNFLRGIQDGKVEIAGIVSRRPDILPRRLATARSVAKLGLDLYFPGKHQVVLAGNEKRKAEFVASQSRAGVIGMIDDNPHKFGPWLIKALVADSSETFKTTRQEIVLGAVHHPRSDEYIDLLAQTSFAHPDVRLHEDNDSLLIQGRSFDIHVFPVEPYSVEAGQAFAARLTDLNNTQ